MCCYLQVYRRSAANEPTARKMMSLTIMFFAVRNVFILFYVVARLYSHFLSSQTIISADLSEQRILTTANTSVQAQNFNSSTGMVCRECVLSFLVRWRRCDACWVS